MRAIFIGVLLITSLAAISKTKYVLKENIQYYDEALNKADSYINERCVLDIYYPKETKNYTTIIWFHGGGITSGEKEIPEALKEKGVAIIGVNYRLSPKVKSPEYIEDAAAAVAWVFKNIKSYGGDEGKIIVSGHSAGGYLALMVGLDKKYLNKHAVDANKIMSLVPFSGHTITHFTVRQERGIKGTRPIIDSLAPLYHVRADASPIVLITGDRDKEMLGRYEENAYLQRMLQVVGHKENSLYELEGYGHQMTYPAFPLLLAEIRRRD